jgi:hypothetical protein
MEKNREKTLQVLAHQLEGHQVPSVLGDMFQSFSDVLLHLLRISILLLVLICGF